MRLNRRGRIARLGEVGCLLSPLTLRWDDPFRKEPATAAAPVRPLAIVVAEDVPEIQDLVVTWLGQAGHVVTRAANGREVVEIVRERPFDLVDTDIVMPGGNGMDAIFAVNRLRPTTRILAISGGGKNMPAEGCLRVAKGLGADAVLLKPFGREQFIEAVSRAATRLPSSFMAMRRSRRVSKDAPRLTASDPASRTPRPALPA